MASLHNPKNNYSKALMAFGLILFLSALLFGLAGAVDYCIPGFGRDWFPFTKIRPLHVSSAIFWILITAMGAVLSFLKEHNGQNLKFEKIIAVIFYLFVFAILAILVSFCWGIFGGREYWMFSPLFSILIILGWILFAFVFLSNFRTLKDQPVYIWMWFTGVLFFLFTYLESNLWLIPGIRNNLIKDMTIQWKSYGSMVGSWNMLIYGSSIYLMDKIAGNKKYSFSNIAFGLYFLSLFNLMFNWGHHVYTLPTLAYVKYIGYGVSMTELFIFGRIIYLWKSSLTTAKKNFNITPYRFLLAADFWVFFTLFLAIPMSVPALNVYMHGTWVIVAHTMGATIGINSMLLLAFCFSIIGAHPAHNRKITYGFWTINISLFVFWLVLMGVGFAKSYWEFNQAETGYTAMMKGIHPWFYLFLAAGLALATGFVMVVYPLLQKSFKRVAIP